MSRLTENIVLDTKEMRAAYCDALIKKARENEKIVVVDADVSHSVGTEPFYKEFPGRSVNCGIMEAHAVGMCAGMSETGLVPFFHAFGVFATRRCFDQIFLSCAYQKLNVKIIGADPGVTAASNGGTHMPFEDVALYNALPGATVIDASDPACLASVLKQCQNRPGIKYIRVGRKQYARIYEDGSELPIGKAVTLKEGTDAVIFAAGLMLNEAMKAAASLEAQGISAAVVDCFTIKPIDADAVEAWAKKTGAVVVAENANRHGGLYDMILEVLAERCPTPAAVVAVEDEFGEVGTQSYLMERFGLTAAHIEAQVKAVLARK